MILSKVGSISTPLLTCATCLLSQDGKEQTPWGRGYFGIFNSPIAMVTFIVQCVEGHIVLIIRIIHHTFPVGSLTGRADGIASLFTSIVPSNPADERIAHRKALIPRNWPPPIGLSALQVRISPRAPGPLVRPSGWITGLNSSSTVLSAEIFAGDAPVLICLLELASNLSTFDKTI